MIFGLIYLVNYYSLNNQPTKLQQYFDTRK